MKLIYVNDALAIWGGLERVLADKINYLASVCHYEILLVTINQGNHPLPYSLHPSVSHQDLKINLHHKYHYRGLKRLWMTIIFEWLYINRLRHVVRNYKPDAIVLMRFDHWEVYFCTQGIPLVVESHSMCISNMFGNRSFLQRIRINLSKYLTKRARVLVTLTEGDAKDWSRYTNKIEVIPNIVYLNESGKYSCQKSKSAIFAGRLSPQKDVFALLRIWKLVHKRHPDWSLNIYGEGECEAILRREIDDLDANVYLHAPTQKIIESFKDGSMLLVTSEFEPFGLVLPEAMSCGLPVVSFDCPYGPGDIITDGVDGVLIKNRDIHAFADKVCQLIEDEDVRRQMGKNGIVSSQRYRADVIMPKWVDLFQKVLSSQ